MSVAKDFSAVFSGSTTSAAIDLGELTLVGIEVPAGFAGISLSFKASLDNVTFQDVYYLSGVAATILTITSVAAQKSITLSPEMLAGFRYLKLVSSASETLTIKCTARNVGR